ncbi:T9SS type A sorting domain-containing protein [Mucilaginibacter sp.]|uniref:T9SS type A sorting domain-containing protein n=1 Tax=Mucilaginibacter sp. TaxID=1882438 RepID=UPI003D14506A
MKKFSLKPGFEFVFSLSLIAILALPPVLLAQTQNELEIKIQNGDTTINGKNIKDLSAKDKKKALKDINTIGSLPADNNRHELRLDRVEVRRTPGGSDNMPTIVEDMAMRDSTSNGVQVRFVRHRKNPGMAYRFNDENGGPRDRRMDGQFLGNGPDVRNSQDFDYVTTDKDGINTHAYFQVSEASREMLKEIARVEEANLELRDLNIVPQFTSGKVVVMFNLPAKTIAEVKLKDSEGKLIWSDKAVNGSFSKSFGLGLNGVYYLQVKQGKDVVLKRIFRGE